MHNLLLLNQTVDLYDEIEMIMNTDNTIKIESNDNIPLDSKNSIYKAAELFKKTYNINDGFIFKVKKRIPIEAGLGGESSDAAGTLILLNSFYNLNKSKKELSELGILIGSDVPFFIYSGFKKVSSIGNKVTTPSFNNPYNIYIIVKPDFGLSTKEMFQKIDNTVFKKQDIKNMPYNDFMKVVPDSIIAINNYFNSINISCHTLSGSGSSYYIALKKEDLSLYRKIKNKYKKYLVMLVNNCEGFVIVNN